MIRHVVLFSAREPADVPKVYEGLRLLTGIAHARVIEVALNAKTDALSKEIDVVVYAEFEDEAELAAFKADPLYQRSIDVVRPLRDRRIAVDFLAG